MTSNGPRVKRAPEPQPFLAAGVAPTYTMRAAMQAQCRSVKKHGCDLLGAPLQGWLDLRQHEICLRRSMVTHAQRLGTCAIIAADIVAPMGCDPASSGWTPSVVYVEFGKYPLLYRLSKLTA